MRNISRITAELGRGVTTAVLAVGFAAVVLTACSGGGSSAGGAATPTAPAGGGSAHGRTVSVTETEFMITLPRRTFTPGRYTFVVHNRGAITHALKFDGPGVNGVATPSISPGQAASVTITLRPGRYEVFCPIANHRQLGMNVNITVS